MSQALYRKWRPTQWDQVVGQEHIIQTLRNQVAGGRTRHAYLFAGPRGTGKTTTARLLAKALNCQEGDPAVRPCDHCASCLSINSGSYLDLIEIDAASNTSVEDVRELRDKIAFAPNTPGGVKVYIIDEVHMLSGSAFNALLKTLEEPPAHAVFILATTDIGKIPATILSRCQRHEFRNIPVAEITAVLKKIAAEEKLDVEEPALRTIARQASGAMRDAISLLDQLSSAGGPVTIDKAIAVLGTARGETASLLVNALTGRDAAAGLGVIEKALDGGADSRQLARQIVEYLRGLLLIQMGSSDQLDMPAEALQEMKHQASQLPASSLVEILKAFNEAASSDRASSWHPALLLEMAFARSMDSEPALQPARASQPVQAPAQIHQGPPAGVQPVRVPARTSPGPSSTPSVGIQNHPASQPEVPAPAIQPERPVPAASQAPASGEPAPASENAGHTFQVITQNWAKIRALIKRQNPHIEALLNSGKLLGVKDNALLIGLPPALKTMLDNPEKLAVVNRALQAVTGLSVSIRITDQAAAPRKLPADIQVDDDGIVGTALRDMGGEVVDIQ